MAPLRVPLKVVRLFSSIAVVPVMLSSLMGKMMTSFGSGGLLGASAGKLMLSVVVEAKAPFPSVSACACTGSVAPGSQPRESQV